MIIKFKFVFFFFIFFLRLRKKYSIFIFIYKLIISFTDLLINPNVINNSDCPLIIGFRDINNCAFSINFSEFKSLSEVDFLLTLEKLIKNELYINYNGKVIPSPVTVYYNVSEDDKDIEGFSFSISRKDESDPIEDNLDSEMQSAIQEIKEKIDLLSLNGLEEFKIKLLIKFL